MITNAIFAVALASAPVQDAPRPPALTNAEACLRENAVEAVRVSSGASDAADFLTRYLCAGPISASANWQRNTAMLEGMRGMLDGMSHVTTQAAADAAAQAESAEAAQEGLENAEADFDFFGEGFEGVTVDQTTGELTIADNASGMAANMIRAQTNALQQMFDDPTPVYLRELAGRLVLEHGRQR